MKVVETGHFQRFVPRTIGTLTLEPGRHTLTLRAMTKPGAELIGRLLRRSAGVEDPGIRWRLTGGGPWFDNQYGVLTVDGRRMDLRIEKAVPDGHHGESRLERVLERRLA